MVPMMACAIGAARTRILRDAQNALHAADCATHCAPYNPAYRAADWSSGPIAGRCAILCAAHNALRLCCDGQGDESGESGDDEDSLVHAVRLLLKDCLNTYGCGWFQD
jgi:hypothetical protein